MGLADIDDGPAFQMVAGDLGGSEARRGFRVGHRPPPWRRARGVGGVGAAARSGGPAGRFAVGASARASAGSPGRAARPARSGGDPGVMSTDLHGSVSSML